MLSVQEGELSQKLDFYNSVYLTFVIYYHTFSSKSIPIILPGNHTICISVTGDYFINIIPNESCQFKGYSAFSPIYYLWFFSFPYTGQ